MSILDELINSVKSSTYDIGGNLYNPQQDYIDTYNYANFYKDFMEKDLIEMDTINTPPIPIPPKPVAQPSYKPTPKIETEEPELTKPLPENTLATPGIYFSPEWNVPISPYFEDKEGNYYTNLPDIYRTDYKPTTMLDDVFKFIDEARNINPVTSDQRVDNMQKVDQRQFFNISPRKIAAGMDALGTYNPEPVSRFALMTPNLAYDVHDAIVGDGTWRSVGYDLAGYTPAKWLKRFEKITTNIPSMAFDIPIGNPTNSTPTIVRVPSMTLPTGKAAASAIRLGNTMGLMEDIETMTGEELLTRTPVTDPDTIQIKTNPFDIDYIHKHKNEK